MNDYDYDRVPLPNMQGSWVLIHTNTITKNHIFMNTNTRHTSACKINRTIVLRDAKNLNRYCSQVYVTPTHYFHIIQTETLTR